MWTVGLHSLTNEVVETERGQKCEWTVGLKEFEEAHQI